MTAEEKKRKEAELEKLLLAARYQLGHRNLQEAQAMLKRAEPLSKALGDSPVARQYQRVQRLAHYVEQFWLAVRESIKQLQTAEQATIDGKIVGIVEVTPRSLTIRMAGRNRTYTLQSMPTGLAFGLAEMWLDKSQGSTYLVLGAYFAVDPKNRKQRAQALWERAAQMGLAEEVQFLLPELKVNIPSTSPLAEEKNSSLARAPDGRWRLPPRQRLSLLLRRWKRRYQNELDQARSPQQRKLLAEKLQQVAQAAPDPLERYLATWLAAEVLAPVQFDQAVQLAKRLAEDFTLAVPEAQAQLAFHAVSHARGQQELQKLAPSVWGLADELAVGGKLDVALRLLRALDSALRKASLKELSQQTQQRIQELRALE